MMYDEWWWWWWWWRWWRRELPPKLLWVPINTLLGLSATGGSDLLLIDHHHHHHHHHHCRRCHYFWSRLFWIVLDEKVINTLCPTFNSSQKLSGDTFTSHHLIRSTGFSGDLPWFFLFCEFQISNCTDFIQLSMLSSTFRMMKQYCNENLHKTGEDKAELPRKLIFN